MNSSHTFHVDPAVRPTFDLYDAPEKSPMATLLLGNLGDLTLIFKHSADHAAWLRELSTVAANLAAEVEARALDGAA